MKKILLTVAVMSFFAFANAQKVDKITLTRDGNLEFISFLLNGGVTLNLTGDGNVSAWGVEVFSDRIQNYSKLDTYGGRVEYYSANDNEAFRGKVKYIGQTAITYFASYDNEAFRGKVKSIGSTMFEYYSNFESPLLSGKIKKAGSTQFDWYTSFDNEALRGKLRMVGATTLNYYTSFDDKAFRGRIKSIGNSNFTYYSSTEQKDYQGAVKTGSQQQTINGVKYYVKF